MPLSHAKKGYQSSAYAAPRSDFQTPTCNSRDARPRSMQVTNNRADEVQRGANTAISMVNVMMTEEKVGPSCLPCQTELNSNSFLERSHQQKNVGKKAAHAYMAKSAPCFSRERSKLSGASNLHMANDARGGSEIKLKPPGWRGTSHQAISAIENDSPPQRLAAIRPAPAKGVVSSSNSSTSLTTLATPHERPGKYSCNRLVVKSHHGDPGAPPLHGHVVRMAKSRAPGPAQFRLASSKHQPVSPPILCDDQGPGRMDTISPNTSDLTESIAEVMEPPLSISINPSLDPQPELGSIAARAELKGKKAINQSEVFAYSKR